MRSLWLLSAMACAGPATSSSGLSETGAAQSLASNDFVLTVDGVVTGRDGVQPLAHTRSVHPGDQLYLTVAASERGSVYVAYCDSQHRLSVYPDLGVIGIAPGTVTRIPAGGYFEVDATPGLEKIFVVATSARRSLEDIDPPLAKALALARSNPDRQPCAAQLEMTTAESRATSAVTTSESGAEAPAQTRASAANTSRTTRPKGTQAAPRPASARVPEIYRPRGLTVRADAPATTASVGADDAGVAILAIAIAHLE
ncbi:MAG TPA: hypothetical protein VMG12_42165 [Polyangiaceae bacterium]|nr:hypothetical protein [Polyangiaceae bacterium]